MRLIGGLVFTWTLSFLSFRRVHRVLTYMRIIFSAYTQDLDLYIHSPRSAIVLLRVYFASHEAVRKHLKTNQ